MNIKQDIKTILIKCGNFLFNNRKQIKIPQNPEKILIFTRKAIGDVIMAIPALEAIRNRYPHSHITFETMGWNKEIAEMLDLFDEVKYVADSVIMHQSIWGLISFIREMKKKQYDMAILFDSFMFPFYCYLARIPVRIGYEIDNEGFALTHKVRTSETEYRLNNFLKIAELAEANVKDFNNNLSKTLQFRNEKVLANYLPDLPKEKYHYVIGMVCGGRNPYQFVSAKIWPSESFAKLIIDLVNDQNALIILLGKGADDVEIVARIHADITKKLHEDKLAQIINLVNKTSLAQAAALFKECDLVVANDTALMHLAALTGTSTLSIFGPTDPSNLAPRGSQHRFIKSTLQCSPCYQQNGYMKCQPECMTNITYETVYMEALKILGTERH